MDIYDIAFHNIGTLNSDRLQRSRKAGTTIVAPAGADALQLARHVDGTGAKLVVIEDVNERVMGVVFPEWVRGQVGQYRSLPLASFTDALEALAGDPSEVARGFRHEWLNHVRPPVFWCEQGAHYTGACPCSEHPNSTCVPEP